MAARAPARPDLWVRATPTILRLAYVDRFKHWAAAPDGTPMPHELRDAAPLSVAAAAALDSADGQVIVRQWLEHFGELRDRLQKWRVAFLRKTACTEPEIASADRATRVLLAALAERLELFALAVGGGHDQYAGRHVRLSEAQREAVVRLLDAAWVDESLGRQDYIERVAAAARATVVADLDAVLQGVKWPAETDVRTSLLMAYGYGPSDGPTRATYSRVEALVEAQAPHQKSAVRAITPLLHRRASGDRAVRSPGPRP